MLKKIIIIMIVTGLIFSVSAILYYKFINDDFKYYYYKFLIEIESNSTSEYEIYAPILINIDDQEISSIMWELIPTGDLDYDFIDTKFGTSLKINGIGNISLRASGDKKMPFAILNMFNDSFKYNDQSFWIFGNISSNSTIRLHEWSSIEHILNRYYSESYISYLEGNVKDGWQIFIGDRGIVTS